jgi:hypothetical protein
MRGDGEGGGVAGSQPMSTVGHMEPKNKLWRSYILVTPYLTYVTDILYNPSHKHTQPS